MYEFYTNATEGGELFFTIVKRVPIDLVTEDILRILRIPMGDGVSR